MADFRPETIHARLGDAFYDIVSPADFPQTTSRFRNRRWAEQVGLDGLTDTQWLAHFGRFEPLPGSLPAPLALRYHGHQFRHYNPDLGDGRGFLFAQLRDGAGRLLDLGTKGSGQTPWSRRGDGRLTLKGGVREVLASAMLEAHGVDTSKAFSLIETGEQLMRGDEPSPTRSAVLVRLSHSHIRIGSFQRLLARKDAEGMARLLAHCVAHYLPEARRGTVPETAVAFLEAAMARIARTTAGWMAAGFVHGVLNTDNINITGESFDYGPFRFLPHYEPGFTAAYFDESGLYAYGRQPEAVAWNLARLAECLLLLAPQHTLEPALEQFDDQFWAAMRAAIVARLGLASGGEAKDDALIKALFGFLHATKAPFEQVMFDLHGFEARHAKASSGPAAAHYAHASFAPLKAALAAHGPARAAQAAHPYFQRKTPVTLLYPDIEHLWAAIAERDDWSLFEAKLDEIDEVRLAYGFGLA
jgi:serine/tyrosine/threonine adenylyltransferase